MSMKQKLSQLLLATSLGMLLTPAMAAEMAAEMKSEGELNGNVTAASQYLWRGQRLTIDAALQGGVNYKDQSGLHGGLWTSNITTFKENANDPVAGLRSIGGSELDVILGYGGTTSGLDYDLGVIFYQFPNGNSDDNFEELFASISQGALSAQFSTSSDMGQYFEVAGTFPVKTWEMTAHFGHYSLEKDVGDDYADYHVNFTKPMQDYDVSFMISDTDLEGDDYRTIVSVSKDFKP